MSQEINITIDDSNLQQYFKQLTAKGRDAKPLLEQLGSIMQDAINDNFNQQGRPGWKPLKATTLKQRMKHGYNGPILQNTGKLKRSITRRATSNYVVVGTNLEYAAIHNFGGPCGVNHSVDMPKREFIQLTSIDLKDLEDIAAKYVDI
jgi:phage virion morphogenesis protein